MHCVYSAASVFATQDDVAFEQRVGGRGARCIWDSSTSSSAITVVVSQSMTAPATGPATSPGAGPVVVQPVGEDNAGESCLAVQSLVRSPVFADFRQYSLSLSPSPREPSGGPAPPAPGPSTSDIVVSEPEAELFETALAVQAYEPPSQSHAVSPLRSSMPDLPDLSNLTSLEHFFSAFTAVPTGLSTPTGLSFILPPSPPPPPLPPVVPPFLPPLLVPPVSPAPPLAASPPSSISSISLLGNLAPPFVPTTPAPTRNPWGVRSPSPLSPSTPEEPLPSSADVAFWEWGPLSLGEVDAWPGLSYVVTQSGIPH